METLTDELYNSIIEDLEKGDDLSEGIQFTAAVNSYHSGIDKIPTPKTDWEISIHLYTALGDAYFNLEEFELANNAYNQALKCPDAVGNGYVWLGLGQSYFELENIEKAKEALMSAYMLEGEEMFEDTDEKYFDLIKPYIDSNNPILEEKEKPFRTFEGKDYTQEEWEEFEKEQWKKFNENN